MKIDEERETETTPINESNKGENDVSKKSSAKKIKKATNGDRSIKLIAEKKFNEGSARGKCYAVIAKHKKLTLAEYLRHCSGREINKAQAISCLAKLCDPKQKVQTVEMV